MCVSVCVSLCVPCTCRSKGTRSPGTRVTTGCEPLGVSAENGIQVLSKGSKGS